MECDSQPSANRGSRSKDITRREYNTAAGKENHRDLARETRAFDVRRAEIESSVTITVAFWREH
jgi:hypothetical protein